jgi:hypothetical protein
MNSENLYDKLVKCEPRLSGSREEVAKNFYPQPPGAISVFSEIGERVAANFEILQNPHAVFELVEEALKSSDELSRTAICTGMIEAMISYCDYHPGKWDLIQLYLGDRAGEYARSWKKFTETGSV